MAEPGADTGDDHGLSLEQRHAGLPALALCLTGRQSMGPRRRRGEAWATTPGPQTAPGPPTTPGRQTAPGPPTTPGPPRPVATRTASWPPSARTACARGTR
ncbi:hypothetical protein CP982_19085 [Streptomyces spectabilis]|uniref:Uncharacterized protein n=1 Tax=Streptomyces spectabilis TaxID=68270 RepID=A0A5P2XDH6_STRST|nr:hypothetical protein CP982_19085 [Streptomyces spectabilis]